MLCSLVPCLSKATVGSVEKSLLHPASFQNQLSGNVSMLFSPISFRLLAQQSQSRLQPRSTLLQFFKFMLCCQLLPIDFSGLLQPSHLLGKPISCHFSVASEYQGVPMRPLDTQITGLAHHCSYRSSHLSPHLNFSNLFHPSFFLFMMSFSHPSFFCPVLSGQSGKFLLYFEAICFHEQGQRGCTLFARCCCHLPPQL